MTEIQTYDGPSISYSPYGFANRYDDEIVLHPGLLKPEFDELRTWIIHHELKHASGGKTTKHDLLLDAQDYLYKPPLVAKQYFKFFFQHPGTWLQASPVFLHNGDLHWDLARLWTLTFFVAIIGIIYWVMPL